MKRVILKSLMLIVFLQGVFVASQNLNIGNLTSLKAGNDVIYVAGQKGMAALKPADMSVIWEKVLPEVTCRLIECTSTGLVCSGYNVEGKKGQPLSAFSSLWDKVMYNGLSVEMFDSKGNQLWCARLNASSKLSTPAINDVIVAVSSNDSLYIFDAGTGNLKSQTYCNEKFLLGKTIKEHAIPNQPLILKNEIINAAPFKLTKIGLDGKMLKSKEQYGMLQSLPVMTVAPISFQHFIFVANAPVGQKNTKEGTARLYCINEDLDKKWDSFVDVNGQTGVSSLVKNENQLFVATNGSVLSFNVKGKKLWEYNKKVGIPDLRGVRYPGMGSTLATKVSHGKFLAAGDKMVYLASGAKVKKNWINQMLILDAKTGKLIKIVDLDNTVVDMDMLGENLVYITEANKVYLMQ